MTFGNSGFSLTARGNLPYQEAIEQVTAALQVEGFGVLTEIDVQATLKKKLGVDSDRYVILGACNPPLAHKSLTAEPLIGLLLPCNVVVMEEEDGSVVVSAVDPVEMFKVVGNEAMESTAAEVKEKLSRVIASL